MSVKRPSGNPVICPKDITPSRRDFEVIGVFNAAAARFERQVILLLRVAERPVCRDPEIQLIAYYDVEHFKTVIKEFSRKNSEIDFCDPRITVTAGGTYLTSLSHFRIATSKDGIHFDIPEKPAITAATEYEQYGIEDPRITVIDGTYYITYAAISATGITTALASTKDFRTFERHGIIFCPDNKDVVLFPEKIGNKFYAIHRPVTPLFKKYCMWISSSSDLKQWGEHRVLMEPGDDGFDCVKIGAGAPPVRIEQGWLELYHGVDKDNRYCMGAVLLDAEQPWKIIARSREPILAPQADYETEGFYGNVTFSCGLLCEQEILKVYYGAADTTVAYAEIPLGDVLANLKIS